MKKIFLVLFGLIFLISVAEARTIKRRVQGISQVDTVISSVTLDNIPTAATSDTIRAFDYSALTFSIEYDETEVGGGVSATVELEGSFDESTWVTVSFFDVAGGVTPQTFETISSDKTYFFWVLPEVSVPFLRTIVTGTNTDTDDTIAIEGKIGGIK